MFIKLVKVITEYIRTSKLGREVRYQRAKTVCVLRCDNCGSVFERDQSLLEPKRRSNRFFHVCQNCDKKRFAQKKGAERRTIWDRPVSSTDDISRL